MGYIKAYVKEQIMKRTMAIKEYKNNPQYRRNLKANVNEMFPLELTYEDIAVKFKTSTIQERSRLRKFTYKK